MSHVDDTWKITLMILEEVEKLWRYEECLVLKATLLRVSLIWESVDKIIMIVESNDFYKDLDVER